MKFVKPMLLLALLSGCAAQQTQTTTESQTLTQTEKYLPHQAYDEKGQKIPYVPAENPYLKQTGTISKGSVLLFIEAKKALAADDEKTAVQKLKVIAEKDPSLAGPLAMLGDISMTNEHYAEAAEYYQKALAINDVNVNAWLGLGEAQRRQGQFIAAQNTYAKALQQWPDFPEAHLNLAVLYDLYLNIPQQAQAHYEAYLFLTNKKTHAAADWYQEVQSRTGINKSFIDAGPAVKDSTKLAAE
ncbi:tetratricopeptide repeat protein [Thalassolituus alkanivorans]|uniref:tetratricopeptide repeat protein n=1 Tax=Thalassolituus alkanivorans TaxID=2881055 RepID=UPI001E5EBE6A|nr:tetratricopeptide repeat protein [Thalassolituus alkanivorans]MCB2387294.1 tetratricopeptide repeat protein [Thalassolituus alkanivorans]MCB2424417.1 tetratricopeptide repeat protein [Thalassolituus alkanivorans]